MRFPINVSFRVTNKAEHDELIRGLQGWADHLQAEGQDVAAFTTILERVRYHDDKGIVEELPDAYVETGGRTIGAGDFTKMRELFQQEVAGHRAKVVLYQRDKLVYKAVQTRGWTNR